MNRLVRSNPSISRGYALYFRQRIGLPYMPMPIKISQDSLKLATKIAGTRSFSNSKTTSDKYATARRFARRINRTNKPGSEKIELEPKTWKPTSKRVGVLAKKLGMTSMWDEWGIRTPVTILYLEDTQVIKVIDTSNENFPRIQIGAFKPRLDKVPKPQQGHFEKYDVPPKAEVAEFPVSSDALLPSGTKISVAHFVPGQLVDVIGTSKGKGFAGVMKRWGFSGGRASHGNSLAHRTPGSTGQNQDPGRVLPGKKMPGKMGNQSVTVMELKVMKIDTELNCLYVKGSVPGNKGGIVKVRDAIKTNRSKKFPDDIAPPFPTYIPGKNGINPLPREMVARVGGKDPLLLTQ